MTKTGSYGIAASPLFFRPNGISICGYLFLCLNTAFFKYLMVSDRLSYDKVTLEHSWVENLTVVWLLLGGLLLFATTLVERDTFRRRIYTLGYLALIFAAGEEISWGQRIFDFPTPQILREMTNQREFTLHSIDPFQDIFDQILHSGTFFLCMMTIATLFYGKESVFRIPLPSALLTFGFLTALCYEYPATPWEYFVRGTGVIWLILLIFMLFFRQYELFFVTATTMIITVTFVTVNWTNLLGIREVPHHEVQEYLVTFGYFWYSLELFLAQNPLRGRGGGWVVQWKKWLVERVQPSPSYFSPACSMTDFLRSPLVITCFFVTCTSLGLLYLGYSAAALRNTSNYNIRKTIKDLDPIIRSDFDVYMTKDEIIYYKSPCRRLILKRPFFLAITPVADNKVPPSGLFFDFWEKGGIVSGRQMPSCLMSVRIPKYEIAQIRTGQWRRWEGAWPADVYDYETTYSAIVSEKPRVRSDFDIYPSGNVLIYTKESCTPSDTEAAFFLHVYPSDKRNLPSWRSQYAFDNRDFRFSDHGKLFDDKCIAAVLLPRYDISRIISGQYTSEGPLWRVEVPLSAGEEQSHEGL